MGTLLYGTNRPQHVLVHAGLHSGGWQAWRVPKGWEWGVLGLQLKRQGRFYCVQLCSTMQELLTCRRPTR